MIASFLAIVALALAFPCDPVATLGDATRASDWIAEAADNICGLSDLRALSDPAKVDYPKLWDATPEIKKIKRDGIDPASAAGISLQQKATDRIRTACDDVRKALGHCSVWKKIRHKDGRTVTDITDEVDDKFPADIDA